MSLQGYLVVSNDKPQVVMPNTKPVTKQGKKQFWFYDNGKALLAVQSLKFPHQFTIKY